MQRLLTAAVAAASLALAQQTCQTQSQPNPIQAQYPQNLTGTINGTVAILPISYDTARSIIPAQFPILNAQYEEWLKDTPFPAGMYPAMLQGEIDNGVFIPPNVSLPTFGRSSIQYPFVDRLNDGYTSFTYVNTMLLSKDNAAGMSNDAAIMGSALYGEFVTPADFDPECDAYACQGGPECSSTYQIAYPDGTSTPGLSYIYGKPEECEQVYPLEFYKNITNQPSFSNNLTVGCDQIVRLFNTSVTEPPYDIRSVQGDVSATTPFFAQTTTWSNVYAIQADWAFVENGPLPCESLQGYYGTGSGN